MMKQSILSDLLPNPAGPYSHVVEVNNIIFTSGFGPQDPATGQVPDGIVAQTEQVLSNLETALSLRGCTLADIVKTTVHLQHLDRDFAKYNAVYSQRIPAPYPARTTVGSTLAGILVEVDAIAIRTEV